MPDSSRSETVRITVPLPADLLERARKFIGREAISSRNGLITAALEQFLNKLEHQEIDRQFEAMADDTAYQVLNEQIAEEF